MKTIFTLIMFCFMWLSVNAQAPEKMSFQAVVRNASGALVTNQAVGMKVSILQGSPAGTIIFQELFNPNPQTNANGLVSIEIGTGIPLTGTFTGINWATGPYYLMTETDPAGGTNYAITGTNQLMSVPYAFYAKNVQNNNDADADAYNEIQVLSKSGNTVTLSKSGGSFIPHRMIFISCQFV